ncbi:hypothetical protein AB3X94_09055 [Paraburkholderia sp. BR10923]|uniref:hypothetical protein n=1 Tax=Paraburkholderia sp. BR10923 TaxID=3236992 RepID=UPI0034CE069D
MASSLCTRSMLQHFLLQFPAIAHQLPRPFVLGRRHVHHVQAVMLATQIDHHLDCIEPAGLRASPMALDRSAPRIDDVTLDAASLQGAADPERVLAGFVVDEDAHARAWSDHLSLCRSIRPSTACSQTGAWSCASVPGRPFALSVVKRNLPLRGREFE